jgi:hypothetical protein
VDLGTETTKRVWLTLPDAVRCSGISHPTSLHSAISAWTYQLGESLPGKLMRLCWN